MVSFVISCVDICKEESWVGGCCEGVLNFCELCDKIELELVLLLIFLEFVGFMFRLCILWGKLLIFFFESWILLVLEVFNDVLRLFVEVIGILMRIYFCLIVLKEFFKVFVNYGI